MSTLVALFVSLAPLSVVSFGSALVVVPEVFRYSVDVHHWVSAREFVDLFAIAQGAPGPNLMFVTAIGWHVAGLPGALVATFAIFGPPTTLAYVLARVLSRVADRSWALALRRAIAPVAVGLVIAAAAVVTAAADRSISAYLVTAVAAAVTYATRLHPLAVLAVGAALGVTGVVGAF